MKRVPKLICIQAVAFALFACGFSTPDIAPEVRYTTLSGQPVSTSDLRGKVVLVNFWATSCEICVHEMPMLTETWRKFSPRGYEMVAVAMSYDHPNLVAGYAQKHRLPFKVALDFDGTIAKHWGGVKATPTTFLVGRDGRIVRRFVGEPDAAELQGLIERTLAASS